MNTLGRSIRYYRRNGFLSTYNRLKEGIRRASYGGRFFLYYCPLPLSAQAASPTIGIERIQDSTTLSPSDLAQIIGASVSPARATEIRDRFGRGCELWLAKHNERFCGFGWTIKSDTFAAHFFPLHPDEVHLFDFYVFPDSRGRGVNIALLNHILGTLSKEGLRCAHLECAAWNTPQIQSLKKSPFQSYAVASKFSLFQKTVVFWHDRAKTP